MAAFRRARDGRWEGVIPLVEGATSQRVPGIDEREGARPEKKLEKKREILTVGYVVGAVEHVRDAVCV